MRLRTKLLGTTILLAALGVSIGARAPVAPADEATAEIGITTHVAGASLEHAIHTNADRIKFQTKDPVAVSVVTLVMDPGATTGWHTHPGLAIIAMTEGTGTLYHADCDSETFAAGEVFIEAGTDPATLFRNETADPIVLTVTFVAPEGAEVHQNGPNPGCPVD